MHAVKPLHDRLGLTDVWLKVNLIDATLLCFIDTLLGY